MRKKIYVTKSDMMALREQGMSNHDIAKSLDIAHATVLRYIGKQEGHMGGLAGFRDAPPKKTTVKQEAAIMPKYEPKAVLEKYRIGDFVLELDSEDRNVMMSGQAWDIMFSYEFVPDLVQFLVWAMRERMEVTEVAETEEVREQDGDKEW